MTTTYYLVECIDGSEFNIYSGSEKECNQEMARIQSRFGSAANPMFISCNRYN